MKPHLGKCKSMTGLLHIGFKLEKNGEDIGLYESDKITRIDAIDDFPQQYSDESCDCFPDPPPAMAVRVGLPATHVA